MVKDRRGKMGIDKKLPKMSKKEEKVDNGELTDLLLRYPMFSSTKSNRKTRKTKRKT